MHTCIWCEEAKSAELFNQEHVLPQSFGTFENSLTLNQAVCCDCNDYFGQRLEPDLGRDSFEGYARYFTGNKPSDEFKSLGRRSITTTTILQGRFAGAAAHTVPGAAGLEQRPFPQLGFASSPSGPFTWFRIDRPLDVEKIKSTVATGATCLRFCECSEKDAEPLLRQAGFSAGALDEFPAPSGPVEVEQTFKTTVVHQRAFAKIALNYLASQFGAATALDARFNPIRAFVRHGIQTAASPYSQMDGPVVPSREQDVHLVAIHQERDRVVGTVSLYNFRAHRILLASAAGDARLECGHLFDLATRRIHGVARTPSILGVVPLPKMP